MRQNPWSNPWYVIPVLLFLNAGLAVLLVVPYGYEIVVLNSLRAEPLNGFFRFCTVLGEWPAFVVIGLVSLLWQYRYAVLIALAGLLISPASYFLKDRIGVDRPITYFDHAGLRDMVVLVPGVELASGQTSFPSGHTMAAFGLYGLMAFMTARKLPWLGAACAWTAILIACSRVFLVQHFLTDILGGALFGSLIACIVWEINLRYLERWTSLNSGILDLFKRKANRRNNKQGA